ncbi:hypothetical protein VQ03_21500 [Methylobacterium tarhaniae]|uniref:Uncharacterized protein n=1 Tax=Methylobacterium tarhaniae TaxID=1187852 RepID=A0A0J6SPN3_9HYPH|nr:hypothetical protein VQ03_21500 [Methylobacterium tarhaniae]
MRKAARFGRPVRVSWWARNWMCCSASRRARRSRTAMAWQGRLPSRRRITSTGSTAPSAPVSSASKARPFGPASRRRTTASGTISVTGWPISAAGDRPISSARLLLTVTMRRPSQTAMPSTAASARLWISSCASRRRRARPSRVTPVTVRTSSVRLTKPREAANWPSAVAGARPSPATTSQTACGSSTASDRARAAPARLPGLSRRPPRRAIAASTIPAMPDRPSPMSQPGRPAPGRHAETVALTAARPRPSRTPPSATARRGGAEIAVRRPAPARRTMSTRPSSRGSLSRSMPAGRIDAWAMTWLAHSPNPPAMAAAEIQIPRLLPVVARACWNSSIVVTEASRPVRSDRPTSRPSCRASRGSAICSMRGSRSVLG